MTIRRALLYTSLAAITLLSGAGLAHATSYAPNTWDCTSGNTSSQCAVADLPAMPTARLGVAAATGPDGFVYVIGGETTGSGTAGPSHVVEAFTPATGWLPVAPMPTARYSPSAVTGRDGYIYVMGGSTAFNTLTDTVEAFATKNNIWGCSYYDANCSDAQQIYSPLPTPREQMAATLGADGRIYTIGGFGSVGESAAVEAYNPATDIWDCSTGDTASGCNTHNLQPAPSARGGASAVTGTDGRIYVFGGTTTGPVLNTVESYSPSTNTWLCSVGDGGCVPGAQTLTPMPSARVSPTAVTGGNARMYVIGGVGSTEGVGSTVEAYLPDAGGGTWVCSSGDANCAAAAQTLQPLPTARSYAAGALGPDHRIYVAGGNNNTSAYSTVEAYTLPSSGPTAARVVRVTAIRRGASVVVRWHVAHASDIAGFRIYAGRSQLTAGLLPVHAAHDYRAIVRFSGTTQGLSLHVVLRNGTEVSIRVR